MTDVARHGNDAGHADAHHRRGEHERPAGADEAAHQAADEAEDQQQQDPDEIQLNKGGADRVQRHYSSVLGLDPEPIPECGGEITVAVGNRERNGHRYEETPAALAGDFDNLVLEVEQQEIQDCSQAAEAEKGREVFAVV